MKIAKVPNLGLDYFKTFHLYINQLLWIVFCIRSIYTKTNALEYSTRGQEQQKMLYNTLDVRPNTTEIVFLALSSAP